MAIFDIKNVKIRGISACVLHRVEYNRDSKLLTPEELEKYIATTGIEKRHCAVHDGSICTSDLCVKAADKLISDLEWDKNEIDALVFVCHTTDYKLPATACCIQHRLGLRDSCMAFDITLGCSGFVYGLSVIGSLLSGGTLRKALLLVGNTQSFYASPEDKSLALLFGDAGTVTAFEYNPDNADKLQLDLCTDGSGKDFLIVPDGGCRNPFTVESLNMENFDGGIKRSRIHEKMDGLEVFSFSFTRIPKTMSRFIEHFQLNANEIDYLCLHQANKYLCEKIRKKLNFPEYKTPYNIQEYGNTSGATIPLLMVTELKKELTSRPLKLLCSGFGVGLSWGVAYLTTNNIVVSDLQEI